MIGVHREVTARAFNVGQLTLGVKDSQGMSTTSRFRAVVIEGALKRDWQTSQVVFVFDDVVIGTCFQCFDGCFFVAHAGDDDAVAGHQG